MTVAYLMHDRGISVATELCGCYRDKSNNLTRFRVNCNGKNTNKFLVVDNLNRCSTDKGFVDYK